MKKTTYITQEELEKTIKELERAATLVPLKNAGKLLMRVVELKRQLLTMKKRSHHV